MNILTCAITKSMCLSRIQKKDVVRKKLGNAVAITSRGDTSQALIHTKAGYLRKTVQHGQIICGSKSNRVSLRSIVSKSCLSFVHWLSRNRIYNLLKNDVTFRTNRIIWQWAALRELEKIEMVRRNGRYRHAVTKRRRLFSVRSAWMRYIRNCNRNQQSIVEEPVADGKYRDPEWGSIRRWHGRNRQLRLKLK